jgi:hypothetical protein
MEFIKLFETHSEYESYINSENKKLPNLSYCQDADDVHLNPIYYIIAKYNVTSTSEDTSLMNGLSVNVNKMYIDGVLVDNNVTSYQFNTIGEHIVKYELINNSILPGGSFYQCSSLTSVTIPNSIITINSTAFGSCTSLTNITIPNSVTTIGDSAFFSCTSLTSVTIPNNVTTIGNGAFTNCSGLTSITIPNSVTTIGSGAFSGCTNLTSVTIGNNVTSINGGAFAGCAGLTSITIPNSVTTLGNGAFSGCSNLTSVTLNSNSIVSKNYASSSNIKTIFGNQVTEYIIGDSVISIGENAFMVDDNYGSALTSVTIGNNVTSIGNYAFYKC